MASYTGVTWMFSDPCTHGAVGLCKSLEDAVEEPEETAKRCLRLNAREMRYLDAAQVAESEAAFPN